MHHLHGIVIALFLFSEILIAITHKGHHVQKRTLIYPEVTVLQFTYGVTSPLILPKRSINLSLCVQINYEPPTNISQLEPMIISARGPQESDYDLNRSTFYEFIIQLLDSIRLDGKSCLLRAICEIAEIPMHVEQTNSLLESIVHYLFTPSEDYALTYLISHYGNDSLNDEFLEAEIIGKMSGKCYEHFTYCQFSLVDLFTKIFVIKYG